MITISKPRVMAGIMDIEKKIQAMPSCKTAKDMPFKHMLSHGYYIRECPIPKGYLITTAIHKVHNPLFLLKGSASILSSSGKVERVSAPYYKITKPGTKRLIYAHEDCIFVTVHRTDRKKIKDVIQDVVTDNLDKKLISKKQLKLMIGG